jgi:hypothetical protein
VISVEHALFQALTLYIYVLVFLQLRSCFLDFAFAEGNGYTQ